MLKKRSSVIFIAIVSIVIIIVAFVIFTYPRSGIKQGDVFTYDIKCFWSSQDPDSAPTQSFLQYNTTEWFKVTVTGVSDADISINTNWRFSNGTEIEGTSNINVETGMTYPTGGFWAIYAAKLKAGDFVRPLGADRSTINETTTRDYGAGGTRETNRISLVLEYYDSNDPTYTRTWTEYMNIHFDRQTGVLVELRDTNVYTNPDMTLTILWTIRDTNVWTIS